MSGRESPVLRQMFTIKICLVESLWCSISCSLYRSVWWGVSGALIAVHDKDPSGRMSLMLCQLLTVQIWCQAKQRTKSNGEKKFNIILSTCFTGEIKLFVILSVFLQFICVSYH